MRHDDARECWIDDIFDDEILHAAHATGAPTFFCGAALRDFPRCHFARTRDALMREVGRAADFSPSYLTRCLLDATLARCYRHAELSLFHTALLRENALPAQVRAASDERRAARCRY